ncbi:haloacid dehalogenase-like hydrolase [Acinetobacter sp. B10A]|uniref:haloacid dehalogenase-like hydrolase n=1 Tax=Acinetobacter baretiae TaxID=2605383 RepID=UPI001B3C4F4B|nr:haloacid dehalogenase-like hydrolase [Acinetobacter baretiae]MBF7685593.1 haloacid dehalogenase-like hydrolase [Acinetobacter baretiae]
MKTKTYKVIGSSLFVWIATYGLSKTQLQHKIEHFSQAIKHKQLEDIHWFDDALVVLKQHIQDGKTVIIATAAPEILAQTLIRSIGLNICVIGTPIKKIWGGWVGYAHCRHIEKVQRLHLMGVQQPWYASYSDDLEADYPLLKHGQHAYLINSKTPHHLLPTEFKITMLQWS